MSGKNQRVLWIIVAILIFIIIWMMCSNSKNQENMNVNPTVFSECAENSGVIKSLDDIRNATNKSTTDSEVKQFTDCFVTCETDFFKNPGKSLHDAQKTLKTCNNTCNNNCTGDCKRNFYSLQRTNPNVQTAQTGLNNSMNALQECCNTNNCFSTGADADTVISCKHNTNIDNFNPTHFTSCAENNGMVGALDNLRTTYKQKNIDSDVQNFTDCLVTCETDYFTKPSCPSYKDSTQVMNSCQQICSNNCTGECMNKFRYFSNNNPDIKNSIGDLDKSVTGFRTCCNKKRCYDNSQ